MDQFGTQNPIIFLSGSYVELVSDGTINIS